MLRIRPAPSQQKQWPQETASRASARLAVARAGYEGDPAMRYIGLWLLGVPVAGIIVMKLLGII